MFINQLVKLIRFDFITHIHSFEGQICQPTLVKVINLFIQM